MLSRRWLQRAKRRSESLETLTAQVGRKTACAASMRFRAGAAHKEAVVVGLMEALFRVRGHFGAKGSWRRLSIERLVECETPVIQHGRFSVMCLPGKPRGLSP